MARDSLGALPKKRVVGTGDSVRAVDPKFVREVVAYRDREENGQKVAIDELECGHEVPCGREPGGRIVRPHAEDCSRCRADLSV